MREEHRRIVDNDKDLPKVRNQDRLKFSKQIEELIRDLSPYPISYDVNSGQSTNFSEFTYTEYLGGIYIKTQSTEINVRLMDNILNENTEDISDFIHCDNIAKNADDKYKLEPASDKNKCKKLGIMIGHNTLPIVSDEQIARLAHENDDFKLKIHPLTNDDAIAKIAGLVGWNKIIKPDVSIMSILNEVDEVHASTATEICSIAVAKDKKVFNISSFFYESSGCYYPINRLLFKSKEPKVVLEKLVSDTRSGIILPWMDDYEQRIKDYFEYALLQRSTYGNLSSKSLLGMAPPPNKK